MNGRTSTRCSEDPQRVAGRVRYTPIAAKTRRLTMRFNGVWKLAAASALAVTMMAPGTMMAQGSDSVLKPAEIQKLLPATVFYRGQTAPTQLRNSGGVKL